jgi:hypothetical protein
VVRPQNTTVNWTKTAVQKIYLYFEAHTSTDKKWRYDKPNFQFSIFLVACGQVGVV